MIKKKIRKELYDKFRQGAIPSGAEFAELIRSNLNLLEDGIDVPDNQDLPIAIRGHSSEEHVFDFCDEEWIKQWRISQKSVGGEKDGLNIANDIRSRLFIDSENGNVGLSNDNPDAKLHITQVSGIDALRIDDEGIDETPLVVDSTGKTGVGTRSPVAKLHVNNIGAEDSLRVDDKVEDSDPFIIKNDGKVGVGFSNPDAKLAINGGVNVGSSDNPGANNLSVENQLAVKGNVHLGTAVTNTVVIPAQIQSADTPDDNSVLAVNDSLSVKNNISVDGDAIFGLDASDTMEIQGNTSIGGDLNVSKDVLNEGKLTVQGDVILGNEDNDTTTFNGKLISGHSSGSLVIDDQVKINYALSLKNGKSVDNISNSSALVENSNNALVTQEAVKAYIDNAVSQARLDLKAYINIVLPQGSIIIWSGKKSNIPTGWALCDGSKYGVVQSPDLRSRFIIGAGNNDYAAGSTGGSTSTGEKSTSNKSVSGSITCAEHQLTIDQMPGHTHTYTDSYYFDGTPADPLYATAVGDGIGYRKQENRNVTNTGGGNTHSHGINWNLNVNIPAHSHEMIPSYFALCFIIKIN